MFSETTSSVTGRGLDVSVRQPPGPVAVAPRSRTPHESYRVESRWLFRPWDWAIYLLLTIAQIAAVAYVFADWFEVSAEEGLAAAPSLVAFWGLTLLVVLFIMIHTMRWIMLPKMREPLPIHPAPPTPDHHPSDHHPADSPRVGVLTTFVPGGESIDMLERTVRALVAMRHPHETWVLDEGDDPTVRDLCHRLGAHHWSRKGKPQYHTALGTTYEARSKHGNYNAFFDELGYDRFEFIVGFDPDHVPLPEFLDRTLGYFADPSVGYVQAPQIYYNQPAGFIARGAAEETYSYYACTQRAAYGGGWPIVTGCHHAHRVQALRHVGGFATHEADDMLITYHYRQAGWSGVYVPEILAKGLTPADWPGYLKQQRRWARSVLDLKLRIQPRLATRLPLMERMLSTIHGLSYLQGLLTLAGLVLLLYMLVTGHLPFAARTGVFMRLLVLAGVFSLSTMYFQRFFLIASREWGLHWRAAFLGYAKWPVLLLAAAEAVIGRRLPYALTAKTGPGGSTTWTARARRSLSLLWPHLLTLVAVAGAWTLGRLVHGPHDPVLTFWAVFFVVISALVLLTAVLPAPPDYDPALEPWPDGS